MADLMGVAEEAAATARTLFKSELAGLGCWRLVLPLHTFPGSRLCRSEPSFASCRPGQPPLSRQLHSLSRFSHPFC